MADTDPEHWLHRLTSDEWLSAARNELARSEAALRLRQQRAGVASARRAAGVRARFAPFASAGVLASPFSDMNVVLQLLSRGQSLDARSPRWLILHGVGWRRKRAGDEFWKRFAL